jgi:two-component system OmpR family sensor kinase
LIKDLSEDELGRLLYTAIFVAMLIVLFLVYVLVILKLRPLKQITQEIEKFSRGDLDLKLDIKSSKEIHEVASALQNAAKSLQCIQNSRKLLLRNIMHELKTPITKGRIAAEMIEDPRQRQRLVQIFGKLNSLINEFAALEAVNSKIKPNFEELRVLDILDEAINIGMFDKSEIRVVRRADPKVKADYRLMAIAFKNLLDNALKYAHSHPVEVVVEAERILFKNSGEPLKKELAHYTEPFTKEHPQSGFGLGLYLVASILKLHNFHLSYHHTQGHNLFAIHFPSQKEESRE